MTIKLPTNPIKPAYLRRMENKVSEDSIIEEARENRMRSVLVEVSRKVDQIQSMSIDDLAIAVSELAEYIDHALGGATVFYEDEENDNVVRPPQMQHFCSFCNDPLSSWSQGMHRECRLAKEKMLADKDTKK